MLPRSLVFGAQPCSSIAGLRLLRKISNTCILQQRALDRQEINCSPITEIKFAQDTSQTSTYDSAGCRFADEMSDNMLEDQSTPVRLLGISSIKAKQWRIAHENITDKFIVKTRTESPISNTSLPIDHSVITLAKYYFDLYLQLSKSRLTLLIVVTALGGYAMAPIAGSPTALAGCTIGTALMSSSANAFNQLLEVPYDSQMLRTQSRVLVLGKLSPLHAVMFGSVASCAGYAILAATTTNTAAVLGVLNVLMYAGVYTPLKRHNITCTWAGAIVGGIPPLMGYTALAPLDPAAMTMGAILFAWQFPHFNALSWNLRQDYSRAGYRVMCVTDPNMCTRTTINKIIRYHSGARKMRADIDLHLEQTLELFKAKQLKIMMNMCERVKIHCTRLGTHMRGPPGQTGLSGANGPQGADGEAGVSGEPGPPGLQGSPGPRGVKGPEGDCDCSIEDIVRNLTPPPMQYHFTDPLIIIVGEDEIEQDNETESTSTSTSTQLSTKSDELTTTTTLQYTGPPTLAPKSKTECRLAQVGIPTRSAVSQYGLKGAWMRDAMPVNSVLKEKRWVVDGLASPVLYEYSSLRLLENKRQENMYYTNHLVAGTGSVICRGSYYYHGHASDIIYRYELDRTDDYMQPGELSDENYYQLEGEKSSMRLPDMAYRDCPRLFNQEFEDCHNSERDFYLYDLPHNYVDFAIDSNGLWAVYSHRKYGYLIVAKLELTDLQIVALWHLQEVQYNRYANTFIMCGVLYGLESANDMYTQIAWAYDLYNRRELEVVVDWYNPSNSTTTQLDFNIVDERLYFFNDGVLLSVNVDVEDAMIHQ